MWRSILSCALLSFAALGCAHRARAPESRVPSPESRLHFLLVNDVYVADTLRDGTGGVARLPSLRAARGGGEPVIFVLAGDVLSPSLLSKWYGGKPMVEAFNAAKLDVATFGNHEFELDKDTLLARLRESRFKWISSNCMLSDGSAFPGVAPWDTTTVGGVRVGLFGLTLQGDYRSYMRCTNPDSAAHTAIQTLRAAGAQMIVGITHQNLSADGALLVREPLVDLILGGHEHEWHRVDVGGRLTVKADADARTAQFVTLTRSGSRWSTTSRLDTLNSRWPLDSTTQRVVRAWQDSLASRLGPERVVGTAPAPIEGRDRVSRYGESALGDLVTDALRHGTGADVAVINSGAMRIDDVLAAGPITNYQLESIFLFADETRVITFPITGAALRELLEHSVSDDVYGHGGFLQVSGISFAYDPSKPSGSRLVGDVRRADGAVLAPTDTVRLAFNTFPACKGGDGYKVPAASAACANTAGAPRAVDLLLCYIAGPLHGIMSIPAAGRITRHG